MRALLYKAITEECPLVAKECSDEDGSLRVYQRGVLGVGDVPPVPDWPFLLVGELPSTVYREVHKTSRAQARTFQVWVFDELGDYSRIEDLMRGVRETVLGLTGRESPSGARCTDVVWQGESQDMVDNLLNNSGMRYISFRMVASQR